VLLEINDIERLLFLKLRKLLFDSGEISFDCRSNFEDAIGNQESKERDGEIFELVKLFYVNEI
jgi:hypothetical protein